MTTEPDLTSAYDETMFSPADEARHQPAGAPWWEAHRLLAVAEPATMAMAMQVLVKTSGSHNSASFHCALFRTDRPPLVIAEADIRAPQSLWEFRSSGLWVDTICETPFEHWSYGLEAFGLEISDPAELLGRGYGDRVPLGWELEFERESDVVTVADQTEHAEPSKPSGIVGYSQRGEAHGIVQTLDGESEFTGTAVRQHWWGSADHEVALPVLARFDEQVNDAFANPSSSNGAKRSTPDAEVALPVLADENSVPMQWWLTRTGSSITSSTRV